MGNAHILRLSLSEKYFWGKLANVSHVASEGALRVRLYGRITNRWQTSTRSQSWAFCTMHHAFFQEFPPFKSISR